MSETLLSGIEAHVSLPGTGSTLVCRVRRPEDRIVLDVQDAEADVSPFRVGQEVVVDWLVPRGIAQAPAEIKARVDTSPAQLVIELVGETEIIQRRDHVRVKVDVPFRARAAYGSGAEVRGHTIDLSGNGMLAAIEIEVWPQDELHLVVELPDEAPVEATARVVRRGEGNSVGIAFEQIQPADRERIVKYVFGEHRRLLRMAGTR